MKTYYFFLFFTRKPFRWISAKPFCHHYRLTISYSNVSLPFDAFAFILFFSLRCCCIPQYIFACIVHTNTHTHTAHIGFRLEFTSRFSFGMRAFVYRQRSVNFVWNANFHQALFGTWNAIFVAHFCVCQSIYTINILRQSASKQFLDMMHARAFLFISEKLLKYRRCHPKMSNDKRRCMENAYKIYS